MVITVISSELLAHHRHYCEPELTLSSSPSTSFYQMLYQRQKMNPCMFQQMYSWEETWERIQYWEKICNGTLSSASMFEGLISKILGTILSKYCSNFDANSLNMFVYSFLLIPTLCQQSNHRNIVRGLSGTFEIKDLRIRPDAFFEFHQGIRVIDGLPVDFFLVILCVNRYSW